MRIADQLATYPIFKEFARIAHMFKIDPIIVLEETSETRRAGRMAAYMVIAEDNKRQADKTKASLKK